MTSRILAGDWVERLRELPSESVHESVSSPPYWQLRDYRVEGQLGLERTPEEFVEKLVAGYREVRRVLRADGTCFVNLGASYARGRTKLPPGWKERDLVDTPSMFANAARADGWHYRAKIIWSKPNQLPSSVLDRPAPSYDEIIMLTKSNRTFFDMDGIREPYSSASIARRKYVDNRGNTGDRINGHQPMFDADGAPTRTGGGQPHSLPAHYGANPMGRIPRTVWGYPIETIIAALIDGRDIWEIPVEPFDGEHTATFPESLPGRCIRAGTSQAGCCVVCGDPLARVVEELGSDLDAQRGAGGDANGEYFGQATKDYAASRAQNASDVKRRILASMRVRRTVGWKKTCEHADAAVKPAVVLDPFVGTGTTLVIAAKLGRESIGIEINPKDVATARRRVAEVVGMFGAKEVGT